MVLFAEPETTQDSTEFISNVLTKSGQYAWHLDIDTDAHGEAEFHSKKRKMKKR